MAKRRSYETKLYQDLKKLVPGTWYKIAGRKDYEKFVGTIKSFIDTGEQFTFSDDYKRIKKDQDFDFIPVADIPLWHTLETLPPGCRVEKVSRGTKETCHVIAKKVPTTVIAEHEGTSYRIYDGDKLIAIEN